MTKVRSRLEKEMEALRKERKQLVEENHVSTINTGMGMMVTIKGMVMVVIITVCNINFGILVQWMRDLVRDVHAGKVVTDVV